MKKNYIWGLSKYIESFYGICFTEKEKVTNPILAAIICIRSTKYPMSLRAIILHD